VGAVRIFEKPEYWDTTAGLIKAVTTNRVSPRVQSYIVSLFDYVIKTVSLLPHKA